MNWLGIVLVAALSWADGSVLGRWKTMDDKTKEPKSIVEISQSGDGLRGRVVEVFDTKVPNPKCDKCQGDKKDQPIVGLEIMKGFKASKDGREWTGGEIIDPENGKTYKCRLSLKEQGRQLEVRGYIGISLLGRSQTWLRDTGAQ